MDNQERIQVGIAWHKEALAARQRKLDQWYTPRLNPYLEKVVHTWIRDNHDALLNEAARREFGFKYSPSEAIGDFVVHMLEDIFEVYQQESDFDLEEAKRISQELADEKIASVPRKDDREEEYERGYTDAE